MIQPGLERIGLLLKNVEFPWKAIHVAGTNGKGSVCAYAHAMLTRRTVRCGRFTSPHLIDRWDCIHINNKPVDEAKFKQVEQHFISINERERINASEFELLTATAFQLFNDHKVEFGVVEVGMGGRLDATNILNNQAVSVITKIAFDHQNFLGNTLQDIAHHKAGILRPGVPYVVNPMNEWNVNNVIDSVAKEVGAGPRLAEDPGELVQELFDTKDWATFAKGRVPFQLDNAVLALLAVKEALGCKWKAMGKLLAGLRNMQIPGRCQSTSADAVFPVKSNRKILVDGAHNDDSARALTKYVETLRKASTKQSDKRVKAPSGGRPVTWVVAMSEGKDVLNFLRRILKRGDKLVATTFGPADGMPWVKPMDPALILDVAKKWRPDIVGILMPQRGALRALMAAKYLTEDHNPIVLTGSLYLVGDFSREKAAWKEDKLAFDVPAMDKQERNRVNRLMTVISRDAQENDSRRQGRVPTEQEEEKQELQKEIDRLESELKQLDEEEARIDRSTPPQPGQASVGPAALTPKQKFYLELENKRKRLQSASSSPPQEESSDGPGFQYPPSVASPSRASSDAESDASEGIGSTEPDLDTESVSSEGIGSAEPHIH